MYCTLRKRLDGHVDLAAILSRSPAARRTVKLLYTIQKDIDDNVDVDVDAEIIDLISMLTGFEFAFLKLLSIGQRG